jgi:hypothetical protein
MPNPRLFSRASERHHGVKIYRFERGFRARISHCSAKRANGDIRRRQNGQIGKINHQLVFNLTGNTTAYRRDGDLPILRKLNQPSPNKPGATGQQ